MAKKEIQLDIVIETADAANTLKDIKKSLKDLKSEALAFDPGSEGFIKATKKAGELQDKLADLQDGISSFNKSPLENVIGSFGKLAGKLTSLDFGGAKQELASLGTSVVSLGKSILGIGPATSAASAAMRTLGGAIAATGIGALVIAIVALISNFDTLKESGGLVGEAFTAIGDIITDITNKVKAFTDALGLTDFAGTELKKKTEENNKAIAKSNKETAEENRKLAEEQINQAIKDEEEAKARREKAKEERKQDTAKLNKQIADQQVAIIKDAETRDIEALKLANQRAIADINNSTAIQAKKDEALIAQKNLYNYNLEQIQLSYDEKEKAAADKKIADEKAKNDKIAEDYKKAQDAKAEEDIKNAEKEKALREKQVADSLNIATSLNSSLMGLSDLYFSTKSRGMKKDSVEALALAKKQFNVAKALQLVGAGIDVAKGITASLASAPLAIGPIPNPAGIASLAAVTTAGAINIAKIASTKFNGGETSANAGVAPAGISAGVGSGTGNVDAVRPSDFSLFGTAGKANNASATQPQIVRAYVSETDITSTQRRITGYKTASEL